MNSCLAFGDWIAYTGANHSDTGGEPGLRPRFFTNCTCAACRAGRDAYNRAHGIQDGSWKAYRLDLMARVSREDIIGPAKAVNPACRITIKYPNWAESYQETGYNPAGQRELFDMIYTGTEARAMPGRYELYRPVVG